MPVIDKFTVVPQQSYAVAFSVDSLHINAFQRSARKADALEFLEKLGNHFDETEGCYTHEDGTVVHEESFFVECHSAECVHKIAEFAGLWEQESILTVNQNGIAYLVFADKSLDAVRLGRFCEITQDEVGEYENYSILREGKNTRFFTVKES